MDSKETRTLNLKINKQSLVFLLFAILIFMVFLLDAATTKVNVCKINGNHNGNSTYECIKIPLEAFPLLRR